jgi:hypothetical protein
MPRPFGKPCAAALDGIVPQSGEAAAKGLTADLKLIRYPRSLAATLAAFPSVSLFPHLGSLITRIWIVQNGSRAELNASRMIKSWVPSGSLASEMRASPRDISMLVLWPVIFAYFFIRLAEMRATRRFRETPQLATVVTANADPMQVIAGRLSQ